jgi:hypothetical protein
MTLGAVESGHVLDDSDDRHARLLAERDLFANVKQADLLRGCDNHGARYTRLLHVLHYGHVLIGGARWRVHQEVLELFPFDVAQELFDQAGLFVSAPDHRIVQAREQKAYRHQTQVFVDKLLFLDKVLLI